MKKKINESLPGQKQAAQASLTVTHTRIGEANTEGKKRIDNQEDISGYLSYVQTAVTALADTIDLLYPKAPDYDTGSDQDNDQGQGNQQGQGNNQGSQGNDPDQDNNQDQGQDQGQDQSQDQE